MREVERRILGVGANLLGANRTETENAAAANQQEEECGTQGCGEAHGAEAGK